MKKTPSCTDYCESIVIPQCIKAQSLIGGNVVRKNQKVVRYSGGFCIVFPYEVNNHKYALRCWHANVDDSKERTQLISDELKRVNLPYFVTFEYVDEGIIAANNTHPIVIMDWVDAKPLKDYIKLHLMDELALRSLAGEFLKMTNSLHSHQISHGDLQHGNILVKDNGDIVLVDYDSMYVPALAGKSDDIKGLVGYQHHERFTHKELSHKADYFSELVIYTSLLALAKYPKLWDNLNIEDTETLLFSDNDLNSKGTSTIFDFLSKDDELSTLEQSMKNALACNSIDELLPLKDAIVSASAKALDDIQSKWANNGYNNTVFVTDEGVESISKG